MVDKGLQMIEFRQGNLLEADAEALVNTVNCVGFMGKGIALQFKQAFPENYRAYVRSCRAGDVQPGHMLVFDTGMISNPRYIVNFPTKRHWRGKSRIEDIEAGLYALVEDVKRLQIRSIAIPPLGCGLGGLAWDVVRPMIESAFDELTDVTVYLYEPKGAPEAVAMPVHTSVPEMTVARALLVKLMERYTELDYRLTLLEIQKLAYFLQEAGEPLRLKYEAGHYGPYAPNLNKVLERIEGHFTRGYGDSQKPDAEISLLPGIADQAKTFLSDHRKSLERLERVARTIEGFETPYGMELLASTHWVAHYVEDPASDSESAIRAVHAWNERKSVVFKPNHIRVAWARLAECGWLGGA